MEVIISEARTGQNIKFTTEILVWKDMSYRMVVGMGGVVDFGGSKVR